MEHNCYYAIGSFVAWVVVGMVIGKLLTMLYEYWRNK